MTTPERRWQFAALRRTLRPANRYPLDRWVSAQAAHLQGLALNVGSGLDTRRFGRRTIRLDRFAPSPDVRADLAAPLPFTDAAFDAVICTEVLEHVADATVLLEELARVLRPGGYAVVTVPFVFHYHEDPEDVRRYTPPGLRRALEHAGFDVEFNAGLGTKLTALCLLAEAVHPIAKILVRLALLPAGTVIGGRARNGRWSDYAANAVAVGRRR
jgi:SAM-dependent methyltransferase